MIVKTVRKAPRESVLKDEARYIEVNAFFLIGVGKCGLPTLFCNDGREYNLNDHLVYIMEDGRTIDKYNFLKDK